MEQTTPHIFPHSEQPVIYPSSSDRDGGDDTDAMIEGETALLALEQDARLVSEVETLLEAIPDAIFQFATNGELESYNIAAQTLWSRIFNEDPSAASSILQLWSERSQDLQGQSFTLETFPLARLLHGETLAGTQAATIRTFTFDGQELYLQLSGKPLFEQPGLLAGALLVVRDMTAPHQLRQDLEDTLVQRLLEQRQRQEREQRVEHLSSTLAEYAYVYDILPDGQLRHEWVSDTLINLLGYSLEELDTRSWNFIQLFHPDDLDEVAARIAAMHAGQDDEREWRIISKNGIIHWLHDSCHTVKDNSTGFIRMYGVVKVITERKEAEQQMWQLNQQLDVMFEAITDAIMVMGPEGKLLRMNSAARDLIDQIFSDPEFSQLSLPERMARLQMKDTTGQPLEFEQTPHYRVLQGEVLKSSNTADAVISTKDGRELILNISGAPIYTATKQLLGAVLILREVSSRYQQARRKQQALLTLLEMAEALAQLPDQSEQTAVHNSQEIATRLLELSCDLLESKIGCILTIEPESGRFQPLAVMGGTLSEQASMRTILAGLALNAFFDPHQLLVLQAGEAIQLDVAHSSSLAVLLTECGMKTVLVAPLSINDTYPGLICIDGSGIERSYPRHEAMMLLRAVGKLIALVIERERLMLARTAAETRAVSEREVNRQKDAFLSLASHELRTPLATIKASIQIARRRLKRIKDAANEDRDHERTTAIVQQITTLLDRGERQVTLEHRLINAILDVSYIHEESFALQPQLFNLCEVIQRVIATTLTEENTHPIVFEDARSEQGIAVIADLERIEQVVCNYLDNAIKYSPEHTPIRICVQLEDAMVRVAIQDRGPGIPYVEQKRIWQRFYQIPDRIIYSGVAGMGLGLYISQEIIRQHHGQVGVDSSKDSGSTFWFTLPVARR
ncbi:hypothetical protein KDA_63350 [Dictyobacter alpinus]|uniref:histidine kinase n=1 Tax=Dictyobacter alpinus TaxID=2014873 RepID=A0A402BHG5_9CHLR|nr:ATP-binding protein [Dictyobacter alpinus]GCE30851.1 hypothetical protein KDA_63350 [Dictyobacter alpinus]